MSGLIGASAPGSFRSDAARVVRSMFSVHRQGLLGERPGGLHSSDKVVRTLTLFSSGPGESREASICVSYLLTVTRTRGTGLDLSVRNHGVILCILGTWKDTITKLFVWYGPLKF
jgi:hypothetical protein